MLLSHNISLTVKCKCLPGFSFSEPLHGVVGSREHGGQNNWGAGSKVEKSLRSREQGNYFREHRKKSREKKKSNREQPKNS